VSIYLPLYRAEPPAAENPKRFREQIERVERSLNRDYATRDVRAMVEKLRSIPSDESFWTADRDGIALFASPTFQRVIDLHRPVDPAVFVADSFHVKPLIRVLQSALPYQVLALTQRKVEMFQGTGEMRLESLDSRNLPQRPDEVSGMVMGRNVDATRDLATAKNQFPGEGTAPGASTLEAFLRAVDKAVWENFSRDAKLPLILAAVEHYHPQFHALSKNQYLLEQGIKLDPAHVSPDRLRQEAWAIMEPRFQAEVRKVRDQFMAAKAHQQGSDELMPVLEAAAVGRVGWLMVDGSKQIAGRVDKGTGQVRQADLEDPRADDVLDDLAEMVLSTDGEVLVLPPEQMPGDAGLAAIYRY
jgi:hypothetical protein